jgi:uncharacterized protein
MDFFTYTGKALDLENLQPADICIEDIAAALSRQCRFAGHTTWHYSVAQHSLIVADLLPRADALQGLMHDATEAYLVDLPTPVKKLLPGYAVLEADLWRTIAYVFGLKHEMPITVKHADCAALRYEIAQFFPQSFNRNAQTLLPDNRAGWHPLLREMTPREAEGRFIGAYYSLRNANV